ncbi:hypothetical protein M422DRAFT_245187 [Sphaerobolus stellatus SS14]|nr:hypothetical protein M422DRAFT_245187 [Sphaerobolus stellatus SS14]
MLLSPLELLFLFIATYPLLFLMPSTHFEDSLLHQNYNSSPPPGHFDPTLYPQPISFETSSQCLSPSRIEVQTPRVPSGNPYPDPEDIDGQSDGGDPEHQDEEQDDGSNDQFLEEEDHQVHTEDPAIYEQWARTEAQWYLLHQTSTDHIARYSQIVDPRRRNIMMMAMLASVKEALEKNDDFKLSELGKKQINTYCAIILLTPDLESYKGDTSETLLVAKLKEAGSGLPLGWNNDPVKYSLIKSAIKSDLTGIRSEMKKKIRASRGYIKDGKTVPAITISDLAKLLARDSVTLNATHWARFAYLRRIYPRYIEDLTKVDNVTKGFKYYGKDGIWDMIHVAAYKAVKGSDSNRAINHLSALKPKRFPHPPSSAPNFDAYHTPFIRNYLNPIMSTSATPALTPFSQNMTPLPGFDTDQSVTIHWIPPYARDQYVVVFNQFYMLTARIPIAWQDINNEMDFLAVLVHREGLLEETVMIPVPASFFEDHFHPDDPSSSSPSPSLSPSRSPSSPRSPSSTIVPNSSLPIPPPTSVMIAEPPSIHDYPPPTPHTAQQLGEAYQSLSQTWKEFMEELWMYIFVIGLMLLIFGILAIASTFH